MSNTEIALRFVEVWKKDFQRVLPELRSLHNETHRKPDDYYFFVSERGLIDQETGRPVREFVQANSALQSTEYKVLRKIESWANRVDEGISVWISPPYEGEYPCAKAIISKIAYTREGQKVLLNSAILFDANHRQILDVIPTSLIDTTEKLRETLFLFADNDNVISDILHQIKRLSKGQSKGSTNLVNRPEVFAEMIQAGVNPWHIVQQMQESGFLGEFPISCPPSVTSFSNLMLSRSQIISFSETSKFVKNCGNCGTEINVHICKGYRCRSCGGVYKGC